MCVNWSAGPLKVREQDEGAGEERIVGKGVIELDHLAEGRLGGDVRKRRNRGAEERIFGKRRNR